MDTDSLYRQLGKFVVEFQGVESALEELVVEMGGADDHVLRTVMSGLGFADLAKSADVIYSWFVEVRRFPGTDDEKEQTKAEFQALRRSCIKLCELRNDLVHSSYTPMTTVDGGSALAKENLRPRFTGGSRLDLDVNDLTVADFEGYIDQAQKLRQDIETFRRQVVALNYPEPKA